MAIQITNLPTLYAHAGFASVLSAPSLAVSQTSSTISLAASKTVLVAFAVTAGIVNFVVETMGAVVGGSWTFVEGFTVQAGALPSNYVLRAYTVSEAAQQLRISAHNYGLVLPNTVVSQLTL